MSPSPRVALVLALLAGLMPAQGLGSPAGETPRAQDPAVQNPFKPFDRAAYEQHVRTLGGTDAQLATFTKEIEELGIGRAAENLMRAIRPAFDAAVKMSNDSDPRAALELAKILATENDAVLGAHVRYQLAKVFLDGDDPERAVEILNEYLKDNINRSPLDPEAAFFYAQSLAEIPMAELAVPRFKAFLSWFPDASERFRASAQQRIGELERQQDSQLHSLADEMKKVTRDLRKQKTDKPVQTEQLDFVERLQELIEMYEQMERQGSGSPSGNQQSSGPADNSQLVEGEARIGDLQKRVSQADRWGDMKDRDRDEVKSAIQNNLPPQYRKMLEKYYETLGKGSGDK